MTDIDPIQTQILEFFSCNNDSITQRQKIMFLEAYDSLKSYLSNNRYSKYKLFELIDNEQKSLLKEVYQVINQLSTEVLLAYLRRIYMLHTNPEYLRVLNILLVNNMNSSKIEGVNDFTNGEHNHILEIEEEKLPEFLDLMFWISSKIQVLCSMTWVMRMIGKGLMIRGITDDGLPKFEDNKRLIESLVYYDEYQVPFSKLALPLYIERKENMIVSRNDVSGLTHIEKPIYIKHTANNFSWAMMNYCPCVFQLNDAFKLLEKYSESIEIILNVSIKSIRFVIYALSKLTGDTIRALYSTLSIVDNDLYSSINLDSKEGFHLATFAFNLLNRGYLRFNSEFLARRICDVDYNNLNNNEKFQMAREFIDALSSIKNTKIEIYSEYVPFVYSTEKNNLVIDYTSIFYFLESLFKAGKEYYATLHGDRFNAYVRQRLGNELTADMFIYDKDRNITSTENGKAQIDIFVNIGNTVYIIECKAYHKNAQYMKGHPKEITSRKNRIDGAVKQAKRSCEIAKEYIVEKYGVDCKFDWIVCSADREFIYPMNKYGFLYNHTPKVCSVEEIIDFFKTKGNI